MTTRKTLIILTVAMLMSFAMTAPTFGATRNLAASYEARRSEWVTTSLGERLAARLALDQPLRPDAASGRFAMLHPPTGWKDADRGRDY